MQTRTTIKNRIHKILDSAGIRLKPALNDLFGKSGYHLFQGIARQKDLEATLSTLPFPRIRRRADQIREALQESPLSPLQLQLLKTQLALFDEIEEKIRYLESLLLASLDDDHAEDIAICISVPGISSTAAMTILAEVVRDFVSPDRLVSWAGLAPSVYQSADTLVTGRITKRESKHLRWILVQAAQAASRAQDTVFSRFFRRIAYRRGRNKAVVALARKILSILWHLLLNRERYVESGLKKSVKLPVPSAIPEMSVDEAVAVLLNAGYAVYTPERPNHTGKGVREERPPSPWDFSYKKGIDRL